MASKPMKANKSPCGDGLLIEARELIRLPSDANSREKAFSLALQAVNQGASSGHSLLAHMYQTGLGTRRHIPNAASHYALAAIHGDANADRAWCWLMALEGFLWHRGDAFTRF